MMKLAKKLLACVLAIAMCTSLIVPITASANDEPAENDILLTYTLGPGRYGVSTEEIGVTVNNITDNVDGTRSCTTKKDIYNSAKFVLPKGQYYFKTLIKAENPTGTGATARVKFENGVNDTYHDAAYAADFVDADTWVPVTIPMEVDEEEDGKRQQIKMIHGSTNGNADKITVARQFFISTDPTPLAVPTEPDVIGSFILEPDNYGKDVRFVTNPDGSRTSTINNHIAYGMNVSPGLGEYYFKVLVKLEGIKKGKANTPAGRVEVGGTKVDMPNAGEFVEGEWKSLALPIIVEDGTKEMRISGNIGAADKYTIAKYVVLSTNDTPMPIPTYDVTPYAVTAQQIKDGFADIGHRNGTFIEATDTESAAYFFAEDEAVNDFFAFRMYQRFSDELTPGPGMVPMTTLYLNVRAKVSKLAKDSEKLSPEDAANQKLFGADMITASIGSVEQEITWGDFKKAGEYRWITMKMDMRIESLFIIDNPDMEFRLAVRKSADADTEFYMTDYIISDVNMQAAEEAAEKEAEDAEIDEKAQADATTVTTAITDLPTNITAADADAVAAARAAYDALSDEAKAYVSAADYAALVGAEAVLEYLANLVPERVCPVTGVALNSSSVTLTAGKTATLTATVQGDNLIDADRVLTWTSTNPNVVKVEGGVLTAVAKGSAAVFVTTVNGKLAYANVTVNPVPAPVVKPPVVVTKKPITKVKFTKKTYTLKAGKSLKLSKIIKSTVPSKNTLKASYKLSVAKKYKKMVKISKTTIKALKKGKGKTILVTVKNGSKKVGTFKIKIKK